MNISFDAVYYEPASLTYELGKMLHKKYSDLPWKPIESHNRIPELSSSSNSEFTKLKQHLIIGVRKTHKYVPNQKISDRLVPYTSSGCRAMCLYCYLVCNYNKCSYLRVFVNREEMMDKLLKASVSAKDSQTFEIGSNSDLILENVVTNNLPWTIEKFAENGKGHITFPTKFDMVRPLLGLNHGGKTIFRMSVNPAEIIRKIELGTSPLDARIKALNETARDGYPVGLLIAPVILLSDWERMYKELIEKLTDELTEKVKQTALIEIILMTYSYVHNAINADAFPNAVKIYDNKLMTGKGRGKYSYRSSERQKAEDFFRKEISRKLPEMKILYIS